MSFQPPFLALAVSALSLQVGADPSANDPLTSAQRALAEHLPDVAAQRLRAALTEGSLSTETAEKARLLLAESLVRSGQAAEVAKVLDPLPDGPARQYWNAVAFAKLGNFTEALAGLKAIPSEASPFWEEAAYNQLEILTSQGQAAPALAILEDLRAQHPEFRPVPLALIEAQLHLLADELDSAREVLTRLQNPTPKALFLLGRIELADNRPKEALAAFAKVTADPVPVSLQRIALLGQTDALLAEGQTLTALDRLISLLATEPPHELLTLLHSRFETLLSLPAQSSSATEEVGASYATRLHGFVDPATLGEDANYATPAKEFACYYLSRSLEDAQSLPLLNELLTLSPQADIAARAEFATAAIFNRQGKPDEAAKHLQQVKHLLPESKLAAQAADLLARLAARNQDLSSARELFAEAAHHPDHDFAEQALLNQTLLSLVDEEDGKQNLSAISSQLTSEEARSAFLLETALAQAKAREAEAQSALNQFLQDHPNHPRISEARLALASLLLEDVEPDLALASSLLAPLPKTLNRPDLSRERFQIYHRFGAISDDWAPAVSFGETHLKAFPESEKAPLFLLRLAESCYRDGDNNRARYLFNKVAEMNEAGSLRDLALLFGARANLAIPTPAARDEALAILKELSSNGGPLATQARLMLARTYLKSFGKAQECLDSLNALLADPADQPEAALLAAEAHRELGSKDPAQYEQAISIYRQLLADARTTYEGSNQLYYLMARTYQESGHPELALEPCFTVVNFENWPTEGAEHEWVYYYQCGFEALDILLAAERNQAALALARKLAESGQGPGAEQAAIRARQIQLDHLLWED